MIENGNLKLIFEKETAKLIALMCNEQLVKHDFGLQTVLSSCAGFNSGSFYMSNRTRSNFTKTLKAVSIKRQDNLITIHYKEEKTGLDYYNYLEFIEGCNIIRSYVEVKNNTKKEQVLTYISSVFLNGIFAQEPNSVFDDENIRIHICKQQWHGEGQWQECLPSQLSFNNASDVFCSSSAKISSLGSWSTGKYAPTMIIENNKTNSVCFISIEAATSYEIEFGFAGKYENGSPYVTANSANENNGGFARILKAGEVFTTDYAVVGLIDGDFNTAIYELTKYRRTLLQKSEIEIFKSIVFNDYMNCLWGDSDIEHLKPLISNAKALGCDVFCVDAGWYNNKDVSWYGNIGDYDLNSDRYGENGLKDLLDEIKINNLIPGVWMEMEVCSDSTRLYKQPDDWFLLRNGKRIEGDDRCFLNFTNPKVCEYLTGIIDNLYSLGIRFIKNDYNHSIGIGADNIDGNCVSGAIKNTNAFIAFVDSIKAKYKDLIIENCAGGGNRSDYKTLQHFELTSVSDQIIYTRLSSIIAGSLFNILPEQLGIWCYPYPSPFEMNDKADGIIKSKEYIEKMADTEQTIYNVVNALCGNMYVSGRIDCMDESNFEVLKDGIEVHKKMQDFIFTSYPIKLSKINSVVNANCFHSVGLINKNKDKILINLFRNESTEDNINLNLFDFKYKEIEIESIFPQNKKCESYFDKNNGILNIRLEKKNSARSIMVSVKNNKKEKVKMTSKQRVFTALEHKQPDRVPTDFYATNEAMNKLKEHFNTDDVETILQNLQVDCRNFYLNFKEGKYPYKTYDDGTFSSFGGTIKKLVNNNTGCYEEIEHYILDGVETIEEAERLLEIPSTDLFDFDRLYNELCLSPNTYNLFGICGVFQASTYWMNTEDLLVNLYANEELARYLIKREMDYGFEFTKKALEKCHHLIDCVMFADDFATQNSTIMSIQMFRKYYKPSLKKLIDLAKSYNKKVYVHCCGSAYDLIPEYLELGVDILDPVQTVATNMAMDKLKAEFGGKITFHGAVETQHILPNGSVIDVRENVKDCVRTLGKDGGYILCSCHYIQSDVPLENILELYNIENR